MILAYMFNRSVYNTANSIIKIIDSFKCGTFNLSLFEFYIFGIFKIEFKLNQFNDLNFYSSNSYLL